MQSGQPTKKLQAPYWHLAKFNIPIGGYDIDSEQLPFGKELSLHNTETYIYPYFRRESNISECRRSLFTKPVKALNILIGMSTSKYHRREKMSCSLVNLCHRILRLDAVWERRGVHFRHERRLSPRVQVETVLKDELADVRPGHHRHSLALVLHPSVLEPHLNYKAES